MSIFQMGIKHYKPGEVIIAEGTYGDQTFLILQGRVMICKETGGTSRIPITILVEGEVFGEMYLFNETGFRTASVVAQNEVTVEVIDREDMERHLARTPPIVVSMIKTLSARLSETSQENTLLKYRNKGGLRQIFSRFFG